MEIRGDVPIETHYCLCILYYKVNKVDKFLKHLQSLHDIKLKNTQLTFTVGLGKIYFQ
jgi:hypothetical protein